MALGRRRAGTSAAPPSVTPPAAPIRVRAVRPRQLLVARRLAQGAVRRAEALRVRLLQGLSTADFKPGSIGPADLAPSLRGR